jgi:hypothetical protein
MKKIIVSLAILGFVLGACGGKKPAPPPAPTAPGAPAPPPPPAGGW